MIITKYRIYIMDEKGMLNEPRKYSSPIYPDFDSIEEATKTLPEWNEYIILPIYVNQKEW